MVQRSGSKVRRQPLAEVAMKELRHRTIQLLDARDRCLQAPTEPNVHELRLAARHLQPVLEFLQALDIDGPQVHRARSRIHAMLDLTGPLRDRQLRRISLATTAIASSWRSALLGCAIREERAGMKRTLTELGRIDLAALLELVARSWEPRSTAQARRALQDALRHRSERLLARVAALDPEGPRSLHKARIALKRYRYLVETFTAYLPRIIQSERAPLKRVQQLLGRWHDERVLAEWLLQNSSRLEGTSRERCRELAQMRIVWCGSEQQRLASRLKTIVHARSRRAKN